MPCTVVKHFIYNCVSNDWNHLKRDNAIQRNTYTYFPTKIPYLELKIIKPNFAMEELDLSKQKNFQINFHHFESCFI